MGVYVYSVSQINKYIKNLLDRDVFLNGVFIEAEISNFKAHSSGHFYFTLKDESASINAVMYKSFADEVRFLPENGMKVTVYGYISLYEKTGQYQIYAEFLEPSGKGALYAAFEQLKTRLEKEGLFDERHKKPLPKFPQKVAVVTSPTGAAIRDIIRISERRNPNVKIIIVPVLVQGNSAPESICKGLAIINKYKNTDAIILGRGGGSAEDLWCFNDERVARAIFKSKIPIVSAVGHETDFTIADFTADFRASTPSAAAEILIPSIEDIRDNVSSLYNNLNYYFESNIIEYKNKIKDIIEYSFLRNPLESIYKLKIQIENYYKVVEKATISKKQGSEINFNNLVLRLEALSPINVLKRGFSIVYKNGVAVNSINMVSENDILNIKFSDGYLKSKIIKKGDFDAKKENF